MGVNIDVKDRVVIITGAGRGMGLTMAKEFLSHGGGVNLVDLNIPKGVVEELSRLGPVRAYEADVRDDARIQQIATDIGKAWGRIDILVNSAGVIYKDLVENLDIDSWNRVMNINVSGTMLCTRAVVPGMKANRWGRIINLSSMQAFMGSPQYSAYTASKAAVIGLTKVWAMELVTYNVTVNALCPSFVRTPLLEGAMKNLQQREKLTDEETMERFVSQVPQGRVLEPEEIAFAALFLSSPLAQGITGSSLVIAAGCLLY